MDYFEHEPLLVVCEYAHPPINGKKSRNAYKHLRSREADFDAGLSQTAVVLILNNIIFNRNISFSC